MKRYALVCHPLDNSQAMATAIVKGLSNGWGVAVEYQSSFAVTDFDYAGVIVLGIKRKSIFDRLRHFQVPYAFIDVGYSHRINYWRISANAYQPNAYLSLFEKGSDRREGLFQWDIKPWRTPNDRQHILVVNSGASYSHVHDLPMLEDTINQLGAEIRIETQREIRVRYKSSITGTPLAKDLKDAFVMVTHGSNACIEAVRAGVPCIVLHDAPARNISHRAIYYINNPLMVEDKMRLQWLNNLSYCQWSVEEFASGEAFVDIAPMLRLTG